MNKDYRIYNIVWFWKIHRDVLAKELNNKNIKIIQINKTSTDGVGQCHVTYAKKRPGVVVGKIGNLYKVIPFETVKKSSGKEVKYHPNIHVKYNNKGREVFLDIDEM
ncbi:hypothetical protein [Spiroplasma sp. SV19]|uniref:hypothetical protein n=1 Tax=Spiroplasma sp. SV19 TaxID=2570468 RepID=UPI0024B6498A|nr:hypothetical protein [Spiroplasma sp. SV19]WHQ37362.1 hypothetical protein E7Y35_05795 [Spiroplasma sp. SV19]